MTEPASAADAVPRSLGSFFLRKFLRDPKEVASIWPSSRFLARSMLRGVWLEPGEAVVELGPGTGSFTAAIVERLAGVTGADYLGIDRDPEFVQLLRARFPGREFVVDDASALPALLAARAGMRPKAVISGLPLVAMPKPVVIALLESIRAALPPGGTFRTFSYAHTVVNPASWWLRRQLRERFQRFVVRGPVLPNLPPALVFDASC